MYSYTIIDFKDCKINPLCEDRLVDRYPSIAQLIQVSEERLLRYATACYDPRSPLIQDFPELPQRKQMAAVLAGYDLERDERTLEGIYDNSNEEAVLVIHNYLRYFVRSMVWAMIVSNEETFWEYNQRLKDPIAKGEKGQEKDQITAMEKKAKLAAEQEIAWQRYERLLKTFYGDDKELQEASEKVTSMTPEQIAKKLSGR